MISPSKNTAKTAKNKCKHYPVANAHHHTMYFIYVYACVLIIATTMRFYDAMFISVISMLDKNNTNIFYILQMPLKRGVCAIDKKTIKQQCIYGLPSKSHILILPRYSLWS